MRYGKYILMKRLGCGGMAEVFVAREEGVANFRRLVCLKRILPNLAEQTEFITMFQDEARIAANLNHPNIVQIYDLGESDGTYYIAMELLKGQDIRNIYNQECIHKRLMPFVNAAQIIYGACNGLGYAHDSKDAMGNDLGLVHRDISPQNILVTYDGCPKILDFGVAKAKGKMTETKAGVLKGKYSYMSPEQANGQPIDKRSDIYAVGIVLYEITTGGRLFKKENDIETLHAVMKPRITLPSAINPNYPPELERIVMKALATNVEERYQTCYEFANDLEKFIISQGGSTSQQALKSYMQELFADTLKEDIFSPEKLEEEQRKLDGLDGTAGGRTPSKRSASSESTYVSNGGGARYGEKVLRNSTTTRIMTKDGQLRLANDNYWENPERYKNTWIVTIIGIVLLLSVGILGINKFFAKTDSHEKEKLDEILSQQAMQQQQLQQMAANQQQPVIIQQPVVLAPPAPTTPEAAEPKEQTTKPVAKNGTMVVNGSSAWQVSINGKEHVSISQHAFNLPVGSYKVKFFHPSGATYARNRIDIKAGRETEVNLPSGEGNIFINAIPYAKVWVGSSTKRDDTPATIFKAQAGDYVVHGQCENGKELTKTTTVTAGNTARVVFNCN